MFSVFRIDHLALTVKNIPATVEFYTRVLGMHAIQFGGSDNQPPRTALKFGQQKINLHEAGNEFEPRAENAIPGSSDLCLITETELEHAMAYIQACHVEILEGPVERNGATGKLRSFYIHDPDSNLIEISNRL